MILTTKNDDKDMNGVWKKTVQFGDEGLHLQNASIASGSRSSISDQNEQRKSCRVFGIRIQKWTCAQLLSEDERCGPMNRIGLF